MKSYSAAEICEIVNGELVGVAEHEISGLEQIEKAEAHQLTFIASTKFGKSWKNSGARVALINANIDMQPGEQRTFIKVSNADFAIALLLDKFAPATPLLLSGIHPTAIVHEHADLGENVHIGAGCYIGPNVKIGKNTKLYPQVTILDNATIGDNCEIWSGTVIRDNCVIGNKCILHSNVSIGADGFGYQPAPDGQGLMKITHIGNVEIGNHVEIGANSCVDRGKFSSTVVGDGTKIDNLVQIAHNCIIGKSCIIVAQSGLAGSVIMGDGVVIAGGVSVKDHVKIGSGATIGARSGVINDIKPGQKVLGSPAIDYRDALKQYVHLRNVIKD